MGQDLTAYRQSEREQARIRNLLDLLPLRGARALDIGARDGYLFQPREAVAWVNDLSHASPAYGDRTFSGENAPAGPAISFYLRSAVPGAVRTTVTDSAGRSVAAAIGPNTGGIHKLLWSQLAADGARGRTPRGPGPGSYTVRLTVGGRQYDRTLDVLPDRWFVAP